jgi:hypothetical protein
MQDNIDAPEQASKPVKTNQWTKNIVTDPEAPAFYSPRAVWAFSLFFTVIFGAVLLSLNLTNKKDKWIVLGFGIAYTGLVILVLNLLPKSNTGITIGLNGAGAFLLTKYFWDEYVGAETKFRTKPIWKPLIISILIATPFVLAAILG